MTKNHNELDLLESEVKAAEDRLDVYVQLLEHLAQSKAKLQAVNNLLMQQPNKLTMERLTAMRNYANELYIALLEAYEELEPRQLETRQ